MDGVLVVFLWRICPTLHAQQYTIQSLGNFNPFSLSNEGVVTGYVYDANGNAIATAWQNGMVSTILPGSHTMLTRIAINDAGQSVGSFEDINPDLGTYTAGFLASAVSTTLFVDQDQETFLPFSINNHGLAAGWLANGDAATYDSSTNTLADLGSFGGVAAELTAVNNNGSLAGNLILAINNAIVRAFVVNNGQAQVLPTLGENNDWLVAMNDNGLAVGTSESVDGNSISVLWKNGAIIPLAPLNPGDQSNVVGINDADQIVGNSGDYPVLWDSNGNPTDLNTLVVNDSGWILYEADAINNVGQIVGLGTYNGEPAGFLLTPAPEPAAISLTVGLYLLLSGPFRRR